MIFWFIPLEILLKGRFDPDYFPLFLLKLQPSGPPSLRVVRGAQGEAQHRHRERPGLRRRRLTAAVIGRGERTLLQSERTRPGPRPASWRSDEGKPQSRRSVHWRRKKRDRCCFYLHFSTFTSQILYREPLRGTCIHCHLICLNAVMC